VAGLLHGQDDGGDGPGHRHAVTLTIERSDALEYMIWSRKDEGNSCAVKGPEGLDRAWELKEGVPRAAGFPANICFRMNERYKKAVKLTDNLINGFKLVIVSSPLKRFLEAEALKNVEYLPVSIINHKDRVASADYFIVNPVEPQDCLDLDKSSVTYNHIIPTDIDWVKQLVLDPKRIDPDVRLFRIKNFNSAVIVRRDLAEAVTKAGFKGTLFLELNEYEG
jgi:hypothetical protein